MPHIARRGLLGLGVATLALSGCSSDAARTNRNFVLVHGSLHGGWCWRRVAKLLRAAGGEVFTPTLTGLGERSHLNSPRIGLTTHIKDVANCIVSEELERVILVGHSYAGIVITGVVQSLSDRISDLVYLDALVPRDGETALDAMGAKPLDPRIQTFSAKPGTDFGITDPNDKAWVQRRLRPQSALTLRQTLDVASVPSTIARTFIACTADRGTGSPADAMRQVSLQRLDSSWRLEEIATGHDAMIAAPQQLSDLLLKIAAR